MTNATLLYCLEPALPEVHISNVQLSKLSCTEVHLWNSTEKLQLIDIAYTRFVKCTVK